MMSAIMLVMLSVIMLVMLIVTMLRVRFIYCCAECHYAACHVLFIVVLNVVMLSVVVPPCVLTIEPSPFPASRVCVRLVNCIQVVSPRLWPVCLNLSRHWLN
jgi:hypothetical protein